MLRKSIVLILIICVSFMMLLSCGPVRVVSGDLALDDVYIDFNGNVYIFYTNYTEDEELNTVKCLTNKSYEDNGEWETLIEYQVENNSQLVGVADSEGNVHMLVHDGNLNYITNKTGSYETSILEYGVSFRSASIFIDENDNLYTFYAEINNNDMFEINLMSNVSGEWEKQTILSIEDYVYFLIDKDHDNNFHIVFYKSTSENTILKYLTNKSGDWEVRGELNIGEPTNDLSLSMAVNNNNDLILAYRIDGNNNVHTLYFAEYSSGNWKIEELKTVDKYCFYPSITANSNNDIYISYSRYYNYSYGTNWWGESYVKSHDSEINYLTNKSGEWVLNNINAYEVKKSIIQADTNDTIHLVFSVYPEEKLSSIGYDYFE